MDAKRIAELVNEVRGCHDLPASAYRAYLEEMLDEIEQLHAIVDIAPTPKDIKVLREANAAFAVENERLKRDLAGEKDNCQILVTWRTKQQGVVERLQAIVDKPPKTADGVRFVIGMRLWGVIREQVKQSTAEVRYAPEWRTYTGDKYAWEIVFSVGHSMARRIQDCYSTREAAEKAGQVERQEDDGR